jgi:4-amino-4-deoxy-L-arabinose transferase-like glycosyltransferase
VTEVSRTTPAGRRSALAAFDRPLTFRDALLVFALALLLRCINVWLLSGVENAFRFEDSPEYLDGARRWLERGSIAGYLAGEFVLPLEREPGYFWFLSGISLLFGDSPVAIALVQGAVDAGTCVLIGLLAARLGPAVARLAGLGAALWPTLVVHASLVLQDTLLLFFLTGFLVALVRFAARPSAGAAVAAGLLFGAAWLVRGIMQFLPLVIALAFAGLAWWRSRRPGLAAAAPLLFLGAMLVPLAPHAYRNVTVFHTTMSSTQAGLHALHWTVTLVYMDQNGSTFDAESRRTEARYRAWLQSSGISEKDLNPFELDRLRMRLAFEELSKFPLWRLAKVWTQGAVISLLSPAVLSDSRARALPRPSFYATPGKNLFERASRYFLRDAGTFQIVVLIGLAASLVAFALQLWGYAVLVRRSLLAAAAAALFVGYFLAVSGPTAGPKYRMPYEPVMIILFALGLDAVRRRLLARRR